MRTGGPRQPGGGRQIAGPRGRSAFIEEAVRRRLINERQKRAIEKYLKGPGLDPELHPFLYLADSDASELAGQSDR